MKKTMLALAIAALPMVAAAQTSQVTMYGILDVGVGAAKMFGNNPDMKTVTRVDDNLSRWGVRGSESLGNGLNAIFQIESWISADGTTLNGGSRAGQIGGRDTFLGLQGGFGKVRLGRLSNYQNSDMETVTPWAGQLGIGIDTLGMITRFDTRFNNAVRYDSPNLGGFDLSLLYSFDEVRANGDNRAAWGIGAGYTLQNLFVKAGYTQYQQQNGSGNKDGNYWRIEGGYDSTLTVIGAFQQSTQYGASATGGTNNIWMRPTGSWGAGGVGNIGTQLGTSGIFFGDNDKMKTQEAAITASYQIGNFVPRASFGWGFDAKVNGKKLNDSGYQQFIVGTDYVLSKRSKLFAAFGYICYDSSRFTDGRHDNEQLFQIGMLHSF
ncbi:MAG: porin [Burkholderiales bacterium]|jgi:predicted porin|nr:porin [Burkholderiales bacterium]